MSEKPRSLDQHKRFFGLVRACYHHWPEAMDFKPDNEEHLRAYLLVKAKHRSIKEFVIDQAGEVARLLPVIAALMLHRYCWAWSVGENQLFVCAPLSTKFDGQNKMDHETACKVYADVDAYLASIGLDPEQLLKETEKAA